MTSRTYLTGDDLIALSARIAAELDKITGRVPSIAEDFNRCLSTAGEAIGRPAWDFNAEELDELAEMVCDAIAGRSGVPMMPVCDHPACALPSTECHGGEIYLCAHHYTRAAAAVASGVEVETWLASEPTECLTCGALYGEMGHDPAPCEYLP